MISASGPACAQPKVSFKHETGRDCVTLTGSVFEPGQTYYVFQNICSGLFSIRVRFTDGTWGSNGIQPGTLEKPTELRFACKDCSGEWEYR